MPAHERRELPGTPPPMTAEAGLVPADRRSGLALIGLVG